MEGIKDEEGSTLELDGSNDNLISRNYGPIRVAVASSSSAAPANMTNSNSRQQQSSSDAKKVEFTIGYAKSTTKISKYRPKSVLKRFTIDSRR
jgi:hypothetical protein